MAKGVYYCGPVKTSQNVFCLDTLEKFIKDWPRGSYLVMNSTPRVTGSKPLMTILQQYNSSKVLVFITTEGSGNTEPGDPYLSSFPDIYSNVFVRPVVCPHLLVRYSNAYNAIDNHNRMRQSEIALDKYWVMQSDYFIVATTVALGAGIKYRELLFYRGVSEVNVDKKYSTREYKNRTVY